MRSGAIAGHWPNGLAHDARRGGDESSAVAESSYAARGGGVCQWSVNARHVQNVPGRKTDIGDRAWLASLARAGLLRGCSSATVRELPRTPATELIGQLASEKNRLQKVLTDGRAHSVSMVSATFTRPIGQPWSGAPALHPGQAPHEVLRHASRRLQASSAPRFWMPVQGNSHRQPSRAR
ncbi:MAG: hypothetical protein IPM40_16525 [Gammaproteobacteria bacterium]|nr:hypothetical protein [Gammaproteobacteria bacterium]